MPPLPCPSGAVPPDGQGSGQAPSGAVRAPHPGRVGGGTGTVSRPPTGPGPGVVARARTMVLEDLDQPRRHLSGLPRTRSPVPLQPAHVRHEHRVRRAHPLELPTRSRAGPPGCRESLPRPLVHTLICTDVHDPAPAVGQPHEVVRSMSTLPLTVIPVQPERLRGDPHHLRITIHQRQPVPLQPRLVAHVTPCRHGVVPAGEALTPLGPMELPNRLGSLEPHVPAPPQRHPPKLTRLEEPQLEHRQRGIAERMRRCPHRPPRPPATPPGQTSMAGTYW